MEKKYFTIDEISQKTGVAAHTIRYWEKKTGIIKPIRLSSGHRRYTLNDLENINRIKDLLYIKGFSLKGLARIKKQEKNLTPSFSSTTITERKKENNFLKEILRDIKALAKSI